MNQRKVHIDNCVFQLHELTVLMLALTSIISSYLIESNLKGETQLQILIFDKYCWIAGMTPDIYQYSRPIPHCYYYYRWFGLLLLFQSIAVCAPGYLWKCLERGRMKGLVGDYDKPPVDEEGVRDKHLTALLVYLRDNMNRKDSYARNLFFCESLNFANTIGQIYIMGLYLGIKFHKYGLDVIDAYRSADVGCNAMSWLFSKVTPYRCVEFGVGYIPSTSTDPTLCQQSIKAINEKILLLMWFWFIVLATIGGLNVLFRVVLMAWPKARSFLLARRAKTVNRRDLSNLCQKISISDWLLLYQLGKNLEASYYCKVLQLHIENVDTCSSIKFTDQEDNKND